MIGTTLAHYRVTAALGAGGMGEVWKATDEKLGREVALKVLPEEFAKDPERMARFEREAKVLASLNHPNIAHLYGLENIEISDADVGAGFTPTRDGERAGINPAPTSIHMLVMELVDGEELSERIGRGSIPIDEAIPIALQIAEALEAAHEQGIVHRDLKPANIKITEDGTVKVLDFGLAKAWESDGGDSSLSLSPTMTAHATAAGVILGTAAYMSPEQARGKRVDRRADIWSFGVVLWEMLTGNKLFDGETVSDVLAAVLTAETDLGLLPSDTPSSVRRVVRRCLERDPRRRLQWIGEARLDLEGSEDVSTEPGTREQSFARRWRVLPWVVAGLMTMAAVWFAVQGFSDHAPQAPSVEASILPPQDVEFDLSTGLAFSPEGGQLAFVGRDGDGVSRLWVRSLDHSTARALEGTEGAEAPFWSPDGRFLGYLADQKIRKIEVATELQEDLADAAFTYGAAWGANGRIVFSSDWGKPMMRISASGGEPEAVTEPTTLDDVVAWPSFLPDGEHFLFLARKYSSAAPMGELRVGSVDGKPSKLLFPCNSNAHYSESGFIFWWHEGNLRAQRFDDKNLELVGEPFILASGVLFYADVGVAAFSISGSGALVYQRGEALNENQLVVVDRDGTELETIGQPGIYYEPRFSPDGRQILLDVSDETNRGDIWLIDRERGFGTRLTTFPEDDTEPIWAPDGSSVVFCSNSGGSEQALFVHSLGAGSEAELLIREEGVTLRPRSWSINGDLLVQREEAGKQDLWTYSFADNSFRPYVTSQFAEVDGDFSPDGRFVAYGSAETGRAEVYVAGFPDPGSRWRISLDGGVTPVWGPEGAELFFLNLQSELMSVAVSRVPGAGSGGPEDRDLGFGVPQKLFRVDIREAFQARHYDTIDGRQFLINSNVRSGGSNPLSLVINWEQGLTGR